MLVGVLVLALAIELALLTNQEPVHPPMGVQVGEPFPDFPVTPVHGGDRAPLSHFVQSGGCALVVGMSVRCPICGEARYTWPARYAAWRSAVGADIEAAWVSVGDTALVQGFYRGFDFGDVQLLSVSDDDAASAAADLGLAATPIHYLVGSTGVLETRVIGDVLPTVEDAARVCGGV